MPTLNMALPRFDELKQSSVSDILGSDAVRQALELSKDGRYSFCATQSGATVDHRNHPSCKILVMNPYKEILGSLQTRWFL